MAKSPDPDVLQARLTVLLNQEKWDQAEGLLSELIMVVPENASVFFNRGLVRRKLGQFDDALTDFEKALELSPYHQKALFEYAALELECGNWERSAAGFESYLEMAPDDLDARYNLVHALLRSGRIKDSRAQARMLANMKPTPATLLALAEAERDCGDLDAMEKALGRVKSKDPAVAARKLSIRTMGNRGRVPLRP